MCRMFGFIGEDTGGVSRYLREFRILAEKGKVTKAASDSKNYGHKDGWGIVYYQNFVPEEAGRSVSSATNKKNPEGYEKYEDACKKIEKINPRIILAHLRKASSGGRIIENTHPFVYEKWSFCHNGTIKKFKAGDFEEPVELEMKGDTDSERFFKLLVEKIKSGKSTTNAIRELIRNVRENYRGTTSLTFLFSDGEAIHAYRDFKNDADYYTLFYFKGDKHVVFSQEKFMDKNWIEVNNGELVTVGGGLEIKSERL